MSENSEIPQNQGVAATSSNTQEQPSSINQITYEQLKQQEQLISKEKQELSELEKRVQEMIVRGQSVNSNSNNQPYDNTNNDGLEDYYDSLGEDGLNSVNKIVDRKVNEVKEHFENQRKQENNQKILNEYINANQKGKSDHPEVWKRGQYRDEKLGIERNLILDVALQYDIPNIDQAIQFAKIRYPEYYQGLTETPQPQASNQPQPIQGPSNNNSSPNSTPVSASIGNNVKSFDESQVKYSTTREQLEAAMRESNTDWSDYLS